MTRLFTAISLVALMLPWAARAQFVNGNEAVTLRPGGTKHVETSPLPATSAMSKVLPCGATAGCHPGPWYMVETAAGLKECTEPWARPTSCRDSSYGTTRRSRLWILKTGKTWLWCQYPDLGSKCVEIYARPPKNLPFDAVQ